MDLCLLASIKKTRLVIWTLLFLTLGFFLFRSVREIWDYNDYEVYHMAGQLALEKSPLLYESDSPEKGRCFL